MGYQTCLKSVKKKIVKNSGINVENIEYRINGACLTARYPKLHA